MCPLDKFLVQWYAVGLVYALTGISGDEDWMVGIGSGVLFMASMFISFQKAVWDDKGHHKDHEKEEGRGVPEPDKEERPLDV